MARALANQDLGIFFDHCRYDALHKVEILGRQRTSAYWRGMVEGFGEFKLVT